MLKSYLKEKNLLTEELEQALNDFKKESNSIVMPFGAHKSKRLIDIHEFKPEYILWLSKQSYVKEKFNDIYKECISLLN